MPNAHLTMMLAGHATEEIIIGETSAGAGGGAESDLARATQVALKLELRNTGLMPPSKGRALIRKFSFEHPARWIPHAPLTNCSKRRFPPPESNEVLPTPASASLPRWAG